MQKLKYKILPMLLLLFSAMLLLCACTPGKNNDKDPGGGGAEKVNAAEVLDIYYEDEKFYYSVAQSSGTLILKTFVTIEGVKEELESLRFDANGKATELQQYVDYKIETCKASKFTLSAYTENEDGSSKSQEKVVEFDNVAINPVLNNKTGDLTWNTNNIFESFLLSVRCTNTTQVFDYPTNTTGLFNVYDVFDHVESDKFALRIQPKLAENVEIPKTTYYSLDKTDVYLGRQTIDKVYYNNGCISWSNLDNMLFDTQLGSTFNVTITDGDQTITKTVTTNQDGYNEIFYYPNHNNFSISVSGGIDYEWVVAKKPVTCTPVCVGSVTNFVLNNDNFVWELNLPNGFKTDSEVTFDIVQDGEVLNNQKYNISYVNALNQIYGNSQVKIIPRFYKSNHYACAATMDLFLGKMADMEIVEYNSSSVKLKLLNIDENASAYNLYNYNNSFSVTLENVFEGMEYAFTPTLESDTLYIKPIYNNVENAVTKTYPAVDIDMLKKVQYAEISLNSNNVWNVKFNKDGYKNQKVECYIITKDNPDGELANVDCSNMTVLLPENYYSCEETQEVKVKIRYMPAETTNKYVQLPAEYEEVSFKNLPTPKYAYNENNKLVWEYTTDLEYEEFVVEFYKNYYTTKSFIGRSYTTEPELDLSKVNLPFGDVYANIYVKAKSNNNTNNQVVLGSNKIFVEHLKKFNLADVYATGQNKVLLKHNLNQGSYANGITNIKVRLYADEHEETKNVSNQEEIDVREYLNSWGVSEVKLDVQIEGGPAYINSDVKTVTIKSPVLDGFVVDNENGTLAFNKFLTNSTYDYNLFYKVDGTENFVKFMSNTAVTDTEIEVKEAVDNLVKTATNVNKNFGNFKLSVTTNVNTQELKNQRSSEIVTLAPLETEFNFYGLTYGVNRKDAYNFSFNFNKQFDTDPRITAVTTDGKSLGVGVLSESGNFSLSTLSEGTHTIVFTNNILNSVLDDMFTLNLPYYHKLVVRGKQAPQGEFENFKKGSYYYETNNIGNYILSESKSTAATVEFVVSLGNNLVFDGQTVNAVNGRYTMNLLKSNNITLSVSATAGLLNSHTYNKYTYTDEEVFSFETYTTPTPQSLNVKNGILNIQVSRYDADAYYNVWVDGAVYGSTRHFTKDTASAKDTYDPSDGTYLPKFSAGQELKIVISRDVEGDLLEADVVLEYTVPLN